MQILVVSQDYAVRCIQSTINHRRLVEITISGLPYKFELTPKQAAKFGQQLMSQAHDAEEGITKEHYTYGKVKQPSGTITGGSQPEAEPGRRD